MNTKHPQTTAVATIYEPTLDFEELIRRASAPTLLDPDFMTLESIPNDQHINFTDQPNSKESSNPG